MLIVKETLKFNLNLVFADKYCENVIAKVPNLNIGYGDLKKIVNDAFELHKEKGVSVNISIKKMLYNLYGVYCEDTNFWNFKPYEFVAEQLYESKDLFMIGNGYYEGGSTCMGSDGGRRIGYLDFIVRGGMVFKLSVVNRLNETMSLGRLLVVPYYCGLKCEIGKLSKLEELKIENMIFVCTNVYLNKLQNLLPSGIESLEYRIAVAKMFMRAFKEYLKMKYNVNFIFIVTEKLMHRLKNVMHSDFYWNGDDIAIMSKTLGDTEFEHFMTKVKYLDSNGYVIRPVGDFFNWGNVDLRSALAIEKRIKRIMEMNNVNESENVVESQNTNEIENEA